MREEPLRLLAYYPDDAMPEYLLKALQQIERDGHYVRYASTERFPQQTKVSVSIRYKYLIEDGYHVLLVPQNGNYGYLINPDFEVRSLLHHVVQHNRRAPIHLIRMEELADVVQPNETKPSLLQRFDAWLVRTANRWRKAPKWSTNPMKQP